MVATLGWLSVAMVVVGVGLWWTLRLRRVSSTLSTAVISVSLWIAACAVVVWRQDEPRTDWGGRSDLVRSLESLAWPRTSAPSPARAVVQPASTGVQAAPVESLVGGLEARLAAEPNDAEGWALLAQSYAFTSNEEAVERAVQRAVALGFDEAALRERVATAAHNAPAFDWVERAIRSPRR
jgi:hypothetical protein